MGEERGKIMFFVPLINRLLNAGFVFPSVYIDFLLRHALNENSLQRQKGNGPLVGSQEQEAFLVPQLHCLSSGCQPVVVFLHRYI